MSGGVRSIATTRDQHATRIENVALGAVDADLAEWGRRPDLRFTPLGESVLNAILDDVVSELMRAEEFRGGPPGRVGRRRTFRVDPVDWTPPPPE